MIHTNLPRNCVVFLLLGELTRPAIYGGQTFDSYKWLTALVDKAKGKPCNFEACLFGSSYSTFKTPFQPYAFHNKRLQMLFIDQLDRSKATCSFNISQIQRPILSSNFHRFVTLCILCWDTPSEKTGFWQYQRCPVSLTHNYYKS